MHGFGRSGDTQASVDAVRSLGVDCRGRRRRRARRARRRACAACVPARSTARNAGTLMRLLSGVLAGQDGEFTLTGDESLTPRPMERVADAAAPDGGGRGDDRRARAARRSAARAVCAGSSIEPAVASAQVKSAILLAGLNADGADDRRRARSRPATTPSACSRLRASACAAAPSSGDRRAGGCAPARGGRRPGRLLLRCAAARRRRARPRQRPHASTISASTRGAPGCSTCSSGWARASRSSTGAAPAGSRSRPCRCSTAELVATEIGAGEVPGLVDELPLVALLASHARGETPSLGRRGAAREGDRPHRGGHRRIAGARRPDPLAARRLDGHGRPCAAERWPRRRARRPPDRHARRRRGALLARGCRDRGRRHGQL